MKTISIILVAVLLFLTDPPMVSSRIPRDGVDPRTQEEEENTKSPEARQISEVESEQARASQEADDPGIDETGAPPCNNPFGCEKEKQEAETDQAEYRRLRIEVIKETILQKLRLKSPPQVKLNRRGLPSVLLSNSEALLPSSSEVPDESQSRSANLRVSQITAKDDDFYGTTKNVFVFPDNSSSSQIRCSEPTSVCLVFRLPPEVSTGTVSSSHIWLYKQAIPSPVYGVPIITNQTLVVSELVHDRQFGLLRKRILSLEDDDGERTSAGGWLRLRVDRAVQRWISKPHIVHALEISCKGCGNHSLPLSQAEGQQPFLVIASNPQLSLSRKRRDVDCTDTTTRCCREMFYLSFREIGWDQWIIKPDGYSANYCRGTCLNDVSTSRYHHTSVLNQYLQNQRTRNEEPTFSLCCTPSIMSSIPMIYMDENLNVFQKNLPNMVAEACDCA